MFKRTRLQSLQENFRSKMLANAGTSGLKILCFMLVLSLRPVLAEDVDSSNSPQALFEKHCSACHSLELPRSQRLDRNTWRWVVDDMVNKFGATWITEQEQDAIIDYLVEKYGPNRPRN